MKDIYYCTKIDKNGNKLTSSYTSEKGAEKYGKGCSQEVTVFRADFTDSTVLQIRSKNEHFDGPIIRGILHNNGNVVDTTIKGQFVIWGKQRGRWFETMYHFPSYSAANTAMKAMISEYQTMAIVDTSGDSTETIEEPVVNKTVSLDMSF